MAAVLGNTRMVAILMVGVLVGVGGGFFLLSRMLGGSASSSPAPAVVVKKEFEGPTFDIPSRVYNLADPNARRYVKIAMALRFSAESDKFEKAAGEEYKVLATEFSKEITPKSVVIQDTLTSIVSAKTMGELLTPDGKEKLKQEIMTRLNTTLSHDPRDPHVTNVYFTDFVVQ